MLECYFFCGIENSTYNMCFVEMLFCHVALDGLELLASGDLHAMASQSTGITSVNHHAPPYMAIFIRTFALNCMLPYRSSFSNNRVIKHKRQKKT